MRSFLIMPASRVEKQQEEASPEKEIADKKVDDLRLLFSLDGEKAIMPEPVGEFYERYPGQLGTQIDAIEK